MWRYGIDTERENAQAAARLAVRAGFVCWLISNIRVYLTGFYESRIRPESQKNKQKVAGKKYERPAFTKNALTMVMVDFALQAGHRAQVTENLPVSCIDRW